MIMNTMSDDDIAQEAAQLLSRSANLAIVPLAAVRDFGRPGEILSQTVERLKVEDEERAAALAALLARADRERAELFQIRRRLTTLSQMAQNASLRGLIERSVPDFAD
jgi:hypothetical protein